MADLRQFLEHHKLLGRSLIGLCFVLASWFQYLGVMMYLLHDKLDGTSDYWFTGGLVVAGLAFTAALAWMFKGSKPRVGFPTTILSCFAVTVAGSVATLVIIFAAGNHPAIAF